MKNSKILYTTDIIIFSVDSRENDNLRGLPKKYFSILLVKRDKEPFKNKWCLPGGYVYEDETSYDAAKRVLKKETNLSKVYIDELGVYDEINRDPRDRTVTVAYMSLLDKSKIKEDILENAKWFDIELEENDKNIHICLNNVDKIEIDINKELMNKESNQIKYSLNKASNIAFDHGVIICDAIMKLRNKANHTDIIFNLMPKTFTIGELKQVYEIILGKKLINSAFRRVIAPKVEQAQEKIKTGGHRPSQKFKYKG